MPRVNDPRGLNGIFSVLRSGAPLADLPERYGPPTPVYNRFVRWRKAGVWDRLMDAIIVAHDGDIQMIDTTSVRVHQQLAAQKNRLQTLVSAASWRAHHQDPRRVVGSGLPIQLGLTPGQTHDQPIADTLLNHLPSGAAVIADNSTPIASAI